MRQQVTARLRPVDALRDGEMGGNVGADAGRLLGLIGQPEQELAIVQRPVDAGGKDQVFPPSPVFGRFAGAGFPGAGAGGLHQCIRLELAYCLGGRDVLPTIHHGQKWPHAAMEQADGSPSVGDARRGLVTKRAGIGGGMVVVIEQVQQSVIGHQPPLGAGERLHGGHLPGGRV